jgi:predicted aspartyl protease
MSGTFSIHNKPAVILFDFGASHSFISKKLGAKLGLDFCHTKGSYMISTPGGKIASNQTIRHVPIKLGSKTIKTELILLALEGMDIILGMNWMALHRVTRGLAAGGLGAGVAERGSGSSNPKADEVLT